MYVFVCVCSFVGFFCVCCSFFSKQYISVLKQSTKANTAGLVPLIMTQSCSVSSAPHSQNQDDNCVETSLHHEVGVLLFILYMCL